MFAVFHNHYSHVQFQVQAIFFASFGLGVTPKHELQLAILKAYTPS
jgi:hypothetical protein